VIGRRGHSSILDVRSFRAADCDTGHYLVIAKIRERLGVNKEKSLIPQSLIQSVHSVSVHSVSRSYEAEIKEKYYVEASNMFEALKDLDTDQEINIVWETIKEIT
jgi:hypothetical protein